VIRLSKGKEADLFEGHGVVGLLSGDIFLRGPTQPTVSRPLAPIQDVAEPESSGIDPGLQERFRNWPYAMQMLKAFI
jgi:hypothetical protein